MTNISHVQVAKVLALTVFNAINDIRKVQVILNRISFHGLFYSSYLNRQDLSDLPHITAPSSINTMPRPMAKHQIIHIYNFKNYKPQRANS